MKNLHALSMAAAILAMPVGKNKPSFVCLTLEDISPDACDKNAPGTKLTVYYARRSDFLVLQDAATPSSLSTNGVVSAAHTFTAPKGFYTLQVMTGENYVKHEKLGGKGSSAFKNTARLFLQGNAADVRGFCNQVASDDLIWIIPLKDGTFAQIGSKNSQAFATPMFDGKQDEATDPRGWEIMVECADEYALYYTGTTITLHS